MNTLALKSSKHIDKHYKSFAFIWKNEAYCCVQSNKFKDIVMQT